MMYFEALGENIWTVEGPPARDLLVVPYPTRMTICRLDDGGLWILSPVKLTFTQTIDIASLGPVQHLIAATPRHHWRLETWHQMFPDAQLWSSKLGPATLGRRSLPANRLGSTSARAWAGQIDQLRYPALGFDEFAFFHRASKTLILEDVIQAHSNHDSGVVNALVSIGGIGEHGGVPRDIRLITRRREARAWLKRILALDFDQIVMAHGPVIRSEAHQWLTQAFHWLSPSPADQID